MLKTFLCYQLEQLTLTAIFKSSHAKFARNENVIILKNLTGYYVEKRAIN